MSRLLCLIIALTACWHADRSPAQTPRSIQSVPSDAAFFFGLHNQLELIGRIADSKTVKKIRDIAGDDFDLFDTTGIEANFNQDENSSIDSDDALSLWRQLLSSDAFVYGDASWAQTLRAFNQISRQANQAKQEQGDAYDAQRFFMSLPEEELAKVRLPATVLALELDNVQPAQRLLDQAHAALNANPPPPWALYRGRKPVGDNQMLVFTLRPWESSWIKVGGDTDADRQAASEKLRRIVDDRELVIAVGVVQSRLTACFAEDLSAVRRLVTAEVDDKLSVIADQTDFASLLSEHDGSLIASAYVSDDFVAARNELPTPGLLSSLSSFCGAIPTMLADAGALDGMQMATIVAVAEQAAEKFASLAKRWDALATKPTGWSAAVWAGPQGFSGRSFTRSVDNRLSDQPLDVQQFTGDHVLFAYSWQSTTMAERLLLAFEAAEAVIDAMAAGALLGIEMDETIEQDAENIRQGRAKLANSIDELSRIIREQWLPSLQDGGHAIVISAVDPIPESDEKSPLAISLLTRVSDADALQQAGTSLRRWANQFVTEYYAMADEPLSGPVIPAPMIQDDHDSLVFRFPLAIFGSLEGEDEVEEKADAEDKPAEAAPVHWRLSDQLLVIGSDEKVSQGMLRQQISAWSDRQGRLRSVAELNFGEISELYVKATKMVPEEDRPAMLQAAGVIGTLGAFRSETRTIDGQTRTYWQLTMPLGE